MPGNTRPTGWWPVRRVRVTAGIASAEAFGVPAITLGPLTIFPTGIPSAEAFGTPVITGGTLTISPTGIPSGEAFGTPAISTGINPTGIPSAEAFGTPTVTRGAVTLSPTGIPSAEAFGTPTVTRGAVTVSPTGIASAEAFGTPIVTQQAAFITRDPATGNLMLNGQRFRFAGANPQGLGLSATVPANAYGGTAFASGNHYATHSEVDATLQSALDMNATVIRVMGAIGHAQLPESVQPTLGVYNPDALETVDYMLQQCAILGLRCTFIFGEGSQNNWPGSGSKHWYCTANGVTPDTSATQFFTNTTIINSYKAFISYILNYVNRYTGIAYKNDPTILAWETINEAYIDNVNWPYGAWTVDIAQHIKVTEGAKQLVMDGHFSVYTDFSGTLDTTALNSSYVDIFSDHPYVSANPPRQQDLSGSIAHSYGKAFLLGEFTWTNRDPNGNAITWSLTELMSAVDASIYVDGDMFWALMAPLVWHGGGLSLHRPASNMNAGSPGFITQADMNVRGTQLTDHAAFMTSGEIAQIMICDSGASVQTTANPNMTFSSTKWVPKTNDVVQLWVTLPTSATITVPAGWTNVLVGNTVVNSGQHTLYCIYHLVTAAEETAGTLFYTANGTHTSATCTILGVVLRGVDPINPVDSAASTFSGTATATHVLAGLTGANLTDDSLVLSGLAADGTGQPTPPDEWGVITGAGGTVQSNFLFSRNVRATAGVNVAATNVVSPSDEYASITVAFNARVPVDYVVNQTDAIGIVDSATVGAPPDIYDGGTPSSAGTDIYDGGTPSSAGTDIYVGIAP